jgi:hypothetical protein
MTRPKLCRCPPIVVLRDGVLMQSAPQEISRRKCFRADFMGFETFDVQLGQPMGGFIEGLARA